MKNYNKSIKTALLLVFAAWALSSCQDWLTIYPQNQVVEENFWEDKNDLEGVRYAAYQQMCNTLMKLAMWGDLRSDTYDLSNVDKTDDGTKELYREIREGHIERDSANTYFDWSGIYQTINYCNKVLQHGPEVLANDKQFTKAEWLQMKAEIIGLRALNYFYLIRAFKDVPYSTKVVNNDKEVMYYGATNQLVVLDSLIADVESVKGKARIRFSANKDTKGQITNAALYAMLSDMYLWRASLHEGRYDANHIDTVYINNVATIDSNYVVHTVKGDYQKAIDYADQAMASLADQNNHNVVGFDVERFETENYGLTNCDMYKNNFENFSTGRSPQLYAYTQIFGKGSSEECIFELPFSTDEKREHSLNGGSGNPGGPWGYSDYTHLTINDGTMANIYTVKGERERDSRLWFSAWKNMSGFPQGLAGYFCFKWSGQFLIDDMPQSNKCEDLTLDPDIYSKASKETNWPIYRLSDVMLQKAEALVALGRNSEALQYVNAIHRRWYCNDDRNNTQQPILDVTNTGGSSFKENTTFSVNTNGNICKPSVSTGVNVNEVAVLNERQIEFIAEGKRWFDLVRYAERHAGGQNGTKDPREWSEEHPIGNGMEGVTAMLNLMEGGFAEKMRTQMGTRFKNRYGLYNLIYYKEVKASNGLLEQNPVWNKSLYD